MRSFVDQGVLGLISWVTKLQIEYQNNLNPIALLSTIFKAKDVSNYL